MDWVGMREWMRAQTEEGRRREADSMAAPHNAWPLRWVRGRRWSSFDGWTDR